MEVKAILWDGFKKLNGTLCIFPDHIEYKMEDFSDTDLGLHLPYQDIYSVNLYKIYDIESHGIEIISTKGKSNVFVVDHPDVVIVNIKRYFLDNSKSS